MILFSRKSLKILYWIHEIQVMAGERIVEPDYKVDKVDLNWGRIGVTQSTALCMVRDLGRVI